MKPLSILYRFTLSNGLQEDFDLHIDPKHLTLMRPKMEMPPAWCRLDFHQCPNCPRAEDNHPFCDVSLNLVDIVKRFERLVSYDELFVEVITEERIYYKKTSAQRGISSLMGLTIAASDCPLTDFFKPMARFHLPFASSEETIWRATSSYMLSQYFLRRKGRDVDFELRHLNRVYSDIQKLNLAIVKRLRAACEKDSAVNAVIILDAFAKSLPPVIEKSLEKLRYIFDPVLRHY
ncbi:hypothetical protein DENIS_1296 [Desulfonema ishimotonii]|uniref:Uncharacterized protein n=1 Tax=Desulfonema ishimotonii TaxID=45657 RepID=A0A401FTR2_9BACT|nr:hypothetical protein [Desulfonema ishimotonii]GBC60345.1 hypothetical protein DENIS_1296 [Desulfonema ishimotonii]